MLGLALHPRGEQLRLYDPARRRWLPTPAEKEAAWRAAEERAQLAEERAQLAEEQASVEASTRRVAESRTAAAEAELARLRALLSNRSQSS